MIEWAIAEYKKHMSMTADLVVLLDRERTEVERLKELVKFYQRQCNESFDQGRASATVAASEVRVLKRDFRVRSWALERAREEVTRLRGVVGRLQDRLANKEATESFDVYNAQNELELLRTIRRSQAEGIMKLRQQLTEACTERDAASKRANSWREDYNRVEQERDVAREGLSQARSAVQALIKERDDMYQEMDHLRKDLKVSQAVNHIISRREQHNPRLEMILEESYRNEFKRNIDNQKATDAPNCQSS